jgi:hypothetical protein
MSFAQKIDFNALMEPVALRLLGEPAQKLGNEWRYGGRGSLAIDLKKGSWFDHEANVGGGVFDLIRRQGYDQPAAWLRGEGLIGSPQVVSRTDPKIVKTYDYLDEIGELLFQVVRFEPKDFKQRRRDGRGRWIWKLGDARRVPYFLPELVKAVAAGETIYIPEGEKDVDNLCAIGLAATTNPNGIKKWRAEYSGYLRGADVVVLPDNHAEGASMASRWSPPSTASLSGSAFSISASIGTAARIRVTSPTGSTPAARPRSSRQSSMRCRRHRHLPITNIPSRSTPGNHQTGQFWTTDVVTYPSSPPTVWARHS